MKVLVLFRRDLRVTDHPALTRAAQMGEVLPLYVVDPAEWRAGCASGRQWEFLAETLAGLREDLAALGAPLVVRMGPEEEVIARLVRGQGIEHILLHDAPWRAGRDAALEGFARGRGVGFETLAEGRESLPAPRLCAVSGVEPGMIPHAKALAVADDPAPHRQRGGRSEALALAESFAAGRGAQYQPNPASPLIGERSGSRLSAHLAFGVLSGVELQALLPGKLPQPVPRQLMGQVSLRGRLIARAEQEPLLAKAGGSRFAALLSGQTGLPFADALLRYFRATGWLNAAGRGLIVSVGAHHLGLDVQAVGQVLARLATDHHPALLQRNLASAIGGRVVDPIRIGEEHDPTGKFLRRWLPELAVVPDQHLHRPWRWTGAGNLLGRRYPEPLVDPSAALRLARDMAALRRRGLPEEDFDVIEGTGPSFRPRPRGPVQLALDL